IGAYYLASIVFEAARQILHNQGDPPRPASSPSPASPAVHEQSTPAQPPGGLEPEDPDRARDRSRERYSGRYSDGKKAYRTNVPRDANNNPEPLPEAEGPHSRLQQDAKDPSRTYSATEFNDQGEAVKRVDFAGRGEEVPHEHPYNPQDQSFGDKHPLS